MYSTAVVTNTINIFLLPSVRTMRVFEDVCGSAYAWGEYYKRDAGECIDT